MLGSAPNIICLIYPGHSATSCLVRFQPKHNSSIAALATFSPVEATESHWHPNLAGSTHMTPKEGILSSKTPCTGSNKVEVGNSSLLPIAIIGSLTIKLTQSHYLLLLSSCPSVAA